MGGDFKKKKKKGGTKVPPFFYIVSTLYRCLCSRFLWFHSCVDVTVVELELVVVGAFTFGALTAT